LFHGGFDWENVVSRGFDEKRSVKAAGIVFAIVLMTLVQPAFCAPAGQVMFGTGTYIIPTDTDTAGQDQGMLRAYGLVYSLLRAGVPVYWVINPAKSPNGNDFTVANPGELSDVRTDAPLAPRAYRGGPFVVSSADAAQAAPIIAAWQATSGDATAVHQLVNDSTINVDVSVILMRAPRLAVLADGSQAIAFNNLNAAGITDASGRAWSNESPDVLEQADVAGPTDSVHDDGMLFLSSGLPRYCHLTAMHLNADAFTAEAVAEVRSWLTSDPSTHAYLQCESARTFENAAAGQWLTVHGLEDDGNAASVTTIASPASPLAQLDGAFDVDTGSVDSMRAIDGAGADYRPGASTLINELGAPLASRVVMFSGRLDGVSGNGRVTELAGHDYGVDLPISANPQTNGVRLFLNSLLASDCAASAGQPDGALTVSAPASTHAAQITYTIEFSNPGPRPAENVRVFDALPVGSTFVSASDGGTEINGVVTWALPSVGPGAHTAISLTVGVTVDATYDNSAEIDYADMTVRRVLSPRVQTTRDADRVFMDGFEIP
jgi:uncharacterized repeat protein (TIGR01451 family)